MGQARTRDCNPASMQKQACSFQAFLAKDRGYGYMGARGPWHVGGRPCMVSRTPFDSPTRVAGAFRCTYEAVVQRRSGSSLRETAKGSE